MKEKQMENSGKGPLISVIIPVHNAEKTLNVAVESILRQTVRRSLPLEVILVDDGSDDASSRLCDALAKEGNETGAVKEENLKLRSVSLQVIHMQDEGVSEARNRGLAKARGSLVTFLDADDAMEPGMLEFLYEMHQKTGAQICGCGFRSVSPEESAEFEHDADTDGQDITDKALGQEEEGTSRRAEYRNCRTPGKEEKRAANIRIYTGAAIIKDAVLLRDTRVWSKLFTREVIGDRRFRKGLTIGEDMLFVVSLIDGNTKYALAKEAKLYRYTVNPKGAMERPFTPSYMDQIRCWEEAGTVLKKNLPEVLKDPEAAARLGTLQIVSDVLTASKIAKLPAGEREKYEREFRICREKLSLHRSVSKAFAGLSWDYRIKAVLLERLPGIYRRLYE